MNPSRIKVIKPPSVLVPTVGYIELTEAEWASCGPYHAYNDLTMRKVREKGITQPFSIDAGFIRLQDNTIVRLTVRYFTEVPREAYHG